MRLNAISPSDNPMEKHLYCFGGDGDGGGSGDGTDDGDVGTAGSGGGVAPGGQASDASGNFGGGGGSSGGFDPGFDAGDVGGVNVGGTAQDPSEFGGGGGGGGSGFYADPIGAPSYPTAPDFGARGRATAVPGFAPPNFSPTDVVSDPEGIAAAQARNALSGATDITSGEQTGTMDLSTMIDPSNNLDPFGEGFMSPEEEAANRAALQRSLALPTLSLPAPTPRSMTDFDRAVAQEEGRMAARGAFAAGQAAGTPTAAGAAGLGPSTPTSAADITVTYGPEDLADAQADFDAARSEAYSDKQFGFDTGLPTSIGPIPTSVGVFEGVMDALFDPTASTANVISNRGIRSVDGQSAVGTPNYSPDGVDVVTSGGPVTEGGRAVAYDPNNNTVFDTNPLAGLNPFGPGVPDNIQDMYDQQQAIDDADRERSGDGGQAPEPVVLPDPVTEECPAGYARDGSGTCVYQGRDVVGRFTGPPTTGFPTTGSRNFNYTGIPSLAPFTLRPTARPTPQPVDPFALLRSPRS